jgi:multiple sugar transport system permease protein
VLARTLVTVPTRSPYAAAGASLQMRPMAIARHGPIGRPQALAATLKPAIPRRRKSGLRVRRLNPRAPLARQRSLASVPRWLFLLPALLYLAALFVYPVLYNVNISLRQYNAVAFIQNSGPFTGLNNFRAFFASGMVPHLIVNIALFVGLSILFQYVIGLALAEFFRRRFPLNALLRALTQILHAAT